MTEHKELIDIERDDLAGLLEIARFYTHWHDKSEDRHDFCKVCEFERKYEVSYSEVIGT
ncbi:unnamed protein product [marine sediment metagenome]|uniref:Uncharacterized protein n=1 Tax=marine sediment metagenome TaxID=412755 RepID=X1F9N6_9ZZZZ